MRRRIGPVALLLAVAAHAPQVAAQEDRPAAGADRVRLFQSYFADARIGDRPAIGAELSVSSFGSANVGQLSARGGVPVTSSIEIEGQLGYGRIGGGSSGLTDLLLMGRYLVPDTDNIDVAGGGYVDLPIGEEDIGGGTLDVGFYGALRWPAAERIVLTGTLGVDFVKGPSFGSPGVVCYPPPPSPFDVPPPSLCFPVPGAEGERVTSINVGGGMIWRTANDALHIVGELRLEPEFDYAALSGGADYALPGVGHMRGAVLVGLDDGAPDIGLVAQIVRPLRSSTQSSR